MVDLPYVTADWSLSSHPRCILDQHQALVRKMKNLATLRYDNFSDDITDFLKSLEDHIDDMMTKCKSDTLDKLSRWPFENARILRQIEKNVAAKGGPSSLSLRDYVEHYVSLL